MENIKKTLSKAVIRMLNPIVHMLLRYEISHSEFTELARRSYVRVAFDYFSIPNRKKTNSRVSVITGLSRKEVVRLRTIDEAQEPVTKGPLNRATRVIGGWLSDADFLDEKNEPKILPLREDQHSFDELVARYSGGITARAVLDELIRVGVVTKLGKTSVKLKHHGYVPENSDAEKIEVLSAHVSDLLGTVLHNLTHKKDQARFQRQVSYVDIPASVVEEFQRLSHDKSLALILELNQWLAEKKRTVKPASDERTFRVGVGVYYFCKEYTGNKNINKDALNNENCSNENNDNDNGNQGAGKHVTSDAGNSE